VTTSRVQTLAVPLTDGKSFGYWPLLIGQPYSRLSLCSSTATGKRSAAIQFTQHAETSVPIARCWSLNDHYWIDSSISSSSQLQPVWDQYSLLWPAWRSNRCHRPVTRPSWEAELSVARRPSVLPVPIRFTKRLKASILPEMRPWPRVRSRTRSLLWWKFWQLQLHGKISNKHIVSNNRSLVPNRRRSV